MCNRLYDASVSNCDPSIRRMGAAAATGRLTSPSELTPPSSPAATTVAIDAVRNCSAADAGHRLHAGYGRALARLPTGRQVFRGLPFDLGPRTAGPRFLIVDRPLEIPLGGDRPASHVVVAHLCDTWRDDAGERPTGLPVGHVVPIGEPLARYEVEGADGRRWGRTIRRRFEVNDGLLGWGSVAFAAVSHLDSAVVDWRGPHRRQGPGRYAPAGQSGSLTIMPGTYGANQVGISDYVPSPTDDALLWLHSIPLGPGATPTTLCLEPLSNGRPGSLVVLAAVTLFDGLVDPLRQSPRFQVRIPENVADDIEVDLGTIIRSTPAEPVEAADASNLAAIIGWGTPRPGSADSRAGGDRIVDLALAPDAIVRLGEGGVRGSDLLGAPGTVRTSVGTSIEVLPPASISVEVRLVDPSTGDPIPGRVRFLAGDGRYLPPDGHRHEVNPGFFEDPGGDLLLGGSAYAYVPGSFSIALPRGRVVVEAVSGFERRPARLAIDVEPAMRELRIPLERVVEPPPGWVTADSHVHFLSPSTALLQAAAEDLDVVNLLAAQWGDLYTNVTDLPWGSTAGPGGRRVIVGTENRQNVLGHLALLGARRPVGPLASGGPPEGRMAGALTVLLADWADRCHEAGGLVVAAHFPLPYAEIAADIVAGKIDAVEAQALSPGLDDPAITEWYRYLNLGYRLPIVAGTDKMSAEVPVGAVRTYTRLESDDEPTFDRWAAAVRSGRTVVSSGPFIELAVEGREPGDVIRLGSPARLQVRAQAMAAQPFITDLEVIVNGRVAAATSDRIGVTDQSLDTPLEVADGAWIAARSRSRAVIESAFTTAMAAHTSPVYVEVAGRPIQPAAVDVAVVEQVILGARTWVAEVAAVAPPTERDRMLAFFDASLDQLRARLPRPPV